MDARDMQALLIRRDAAMRLIQEYDEEGRWELLRMIIDPDPDVLAASMEMAEEMGEPSKLAYDMCVRAASEKARRRTFSFAA